MPPERTRWRPGQSGNPGGRPRGLIELVRKSTKDGEDLVSFFVAIFHGEKKALGRAPKSRQRIEAAEWLADCGWGRAAFRDLDGPSEPLTVIVKAHRDF